MSRPETDPSLKVPEVEKRFWQNVEKTDSCWNWTGRLITGGYGSFYHPLYRTGSAHRTSYLMANGSIPPDRMVCHRCNNPRCVRPDHLYAGTAKDNAQDRVRLVEELNAGTERIKIYLSPDAHRSLRIQSAAEGKTKSAIVEEALRLLRKDKTQMTAKWSDLIVYDTDGYAQGTLADMVNAAPANLDDAVIEDGAITEWFGWFLGLPGEEYSEEIPAADWTGFEDALAPSRGLA